MNERIRELIKQAGGHFSTHTLMSNPVQYRESIELWDKNIEKFAELIIDEVYSFLLDPSEDDEPWHSRTEVKKHFGIGK